MDRAILDGVFISEQLFSCFKNTVIKKKKTRYNYALELCFEYLKETCLD